VAAGGGDTGSSGGTPSSLPGLLEDIYNFFSDLFGGGGGQSLPPNYFVYKARVERARRHPQYPEIDGAAIDIVLNQSPAAPEFCADPHPCNTPPLQSGAQPEYRKAPSIAAQEPLGFWTCEGIFAAFTTPAIAACGVYGYACANGAIPACPLAVAACGYEIAGAKGCYDQAHGKPFPALPEPPPGDAPQRGDFGLP